MGWSTSPIERPRERAAYQSHRAGLAADPGVEAPRRVPGVRLKGRVIIRAGRLGPAGLLMNDAEGIAYRRPQRLRRGLSERPSTWTAHEGTRDGHQHLLQTSASDSRRLLALQLDPDLLDRLVLRVVMRRHVRLGRAERAEVSAGGREAVVTREGRADDRDYSVTIALCQLVITLTVCSLVSASVFTRKRDILALKQSRARHHLVEHDTEGPDVCTESPSASHVPAPETCRRPCRE